MCVEVNGVRRKERKKWRESGIVRQAIKEKKEAYENWQKTKKEGREVFKEKKKKVRKEAVKVKYKNTEEWVREREGEIEKIYKKMKRLKLRNK